MSDRKTLYLHIGVHRTATTAVQATMFANREKLRTEGFLYPLGVRRHIGLFNDIFADKTTSDDAGKLLLQRAGANKNSIHSVVLSDEAVSKRRDLSKLAALQKYFDVKVVFAMRRQDLWLESWWAQNVKGQWDRKFCHMSWPDFMSKREKFHWINYDRYIRHIETVFGQGSVIPYVFERNQMPDGPIAAFLQAIGFHGYSRLKKGGGSNTSLTPEVSEFVRHLPLIDAPMKLRLKLIEVAEQLDHKIRSEKATTLMIPFDQRQSIMNEYAPGNRKVANRFFGRDELFVEPLPDKSASVVAPAIPQDTEEMMQRLMTPFMSELIKKFSDK